MLIYIRMSDSDNDYNSDDDFVCKKTTSLTDDYLQTQDSSSDSGNDSESESESESESDDETDNDFESNLEIKPTKLNNFKVLLEKQFPKNINDEQELFRYRTINYLIWKKGNDIICDIHTHFDATYSQNKICVKLLLEVFDQENKLKEYIFNKQDKKEKQYIKIDDVIKFFIDEIHNEKSKYCCNKKNNTIGKYCIYMPIIYYILGITIDYNKDYRPNLDNIDEKLWDKIQPKRSEWDISNAIQNYLLNHDLFSKYPDDLRIRYQYELHGKKYDLAIGNYIGIEYNEKSNEHKNNSNDINKELILHVSGFVSMQFYEVMLDNDVSYIKIFFSNLENKLSEQIISNSIRDSDLEIYNFEQEYNFKQFYIYCEKEVENLNNEIKDIVNSDYKHKKKLINGKKKALEKWNLFFENKKPNIIFKKLYNYKIEGDKAHKQNPQNKYALYNISLNFVINTLFTSKIGSTSKIIKKIAWEYLELINSELYFSWYSLAEFINSMNNKTLNDLKTMNFKLLIKIQELVENTSDIKLKNKNNIIEKFKSDFSEILDENKKTFDSKLESQKKIHENKITKLNGEIKALQILNKSNDQIISNIDKIKDFTINTYNFANYCYKYTLVGVDNLKETIKLMKTNTDEFNNNYDKCIIESEELVSTMSYYLNNNNINEIKIQINELKNGKIQNITRKNMCSILTKMNSSIRNIKKDIINIYDNKLINKNFKDINNLFISLESVSQEVKLQEKNQIGINNYQINLNQVGKPIISGTVSLSKGNSNVSPLPIILTDNIDDSILFTSVEGIFKAFDIPIELLKKFYQLKAKRDLKNINGTMIPYIKLLES